VADALKVLSDSGVPVYFIRGNRDFLLGEDYARRAGLRILPDPCVIELYGRPVLLQHGDLLCTDDIPYQQFRAQTRDPAFQAQFLSQPLAARIAFAQKAREASQARQSEMKQDDRAQFESVTDVAPSEVDATFVRHGVDTMIHGHTHRPAIHTLQAGGRAAPASCWVTGTNRVRCCAWMPAAGRWIRSRANDGSQGANQGWHLPEQVHAPG
jgi:UDP-2,3-diacylglucosamine hydrolase